jgi:small-conductance mechanosensitive channel
MDINQVHRSGYKHLWRQANIRLLPSAALCVAGAITSAAYGNIRSGNFDRKLIAVLGIVVFVLFATAFLHVLTKTITRLIALSHLTIGRAVAIQFALRIIGYVAVFLITLDLFGVPVGKLLLGGAALGIILGVAAQQALANFFASIVLIISHPFSVGDEIIINSGALGGKYVGRVKDIGLTHTRLEDEKGNLVLLPNATLLSSASIMMEKNPV